MADERYATRDVSSKPSTLRTAKAEAELTVSPATIAALRSGKVPKADPIGVAKVAAIQAAKNTSLLIPHCHQVPLDYVGVDIILEASAIRVSTEVKAVWKTGVEMEALVAASTGALALYDMLKAIDEQMAIGTVRLIEKRGGMSSIRFGADGRKTAVVVLSDSVSAGKSKDKSGALLVERLSALGFPEPRLTVLPDDRVKLEAELCRLADKEHCDLVVTTGGTGAGPRDTTPEATLAVIERRLDGIEEAVRAFGRDRLPMAMLTRCVAGIRGSTVIVNLPGSPGGAADGIDALFPGLFHIFPMMQGGGH